MGARRTGWRALTLVGAIDDATGPVPWAVFVDHVGLPAAVLAPREAAGAPAGRLRRSAIELLRAPTLQGQLAGRRPLTQVGRALHELGLPLIPAGSPQAKGRVERWWGTFQDRLVSELRRAGATTPAEAQAVLERVLPQHTRRFAKAPAEAVPAWRLVDRLRLLQPLCFTYRRVVATDTTVAFQGVVLPLPQRSPFVSWAHQGVDVHVLLDGSVDSSFHHDHLARFDSTTARTVGLSRTSGRREVVSYGPETTTAAHRYAHAP